MCSGRDTRALPRVGSPIRKSPGQRLFGTLPELIAACRVLHRLSSPRHSPCALTNLIVKNTSLLCSFQGTRRKIRPWHRRKADTKLQKFSELDMVLIYHRAPGKTDALILPLKTGVAASRPLRRSNYVKPHVPRSGAEDTGADRPSGLPGTSSRRRRQKLPLR